MPSKSFRGAGDVLIANRESVGCSCASPGLAVAWSTQWRMEILNHLSLDLVANSDAGVAAGDGDLADVLFSKEINAPIRLVLLLDD